MRTISTEKHFREWAASDDRHGLLTNTIYLEQFVHVPQGHALHRAPADHDSLIGCTFKPGILRMDGILDVGPFQVFSHCVHLDERNKTLPSVYGHNGGQPRHVEWFKSTSGRDCDQDEFQCALDFGSITEDRMPLMACHEVRCGFNKVTLTKPLRFAARRITLDGGGRDVLHFEVDIRDQHAGHEATGILVSDPAYDDIGGIFSTNIGGFSISKADTCVDGVSLIRCAGSVDESTRIHDVWTYANAFRAIHLEGGQNTASFENITIGNKLSNKHEAGAIGFLIEGGPRRGGVRIDNFSCIGKLAHAFAVRTNCAVTGRCWHIENSQNSGISITGPRAAIDIETIDFDGFDDKRAGVHIDSSSAHVSIRGIRTDHRTLGMTILHDEQTEFRSANSENRSPRRSLHSYDRWLEHDNAGKLTHEARCERQAF